MLRFLLSGLFWLLCCLGPVAIAQTETQRLSREIEQMPGGPAKVQRLIAASRAVIGNNPTAAFGYGRQAITLAARLNLKEERGTALSNLGFLYFEARQFDDLIPHLEQTIAWRKTNLPGLPLELARDYRMIGNAYEAKQQHDKAYRQYEQAVVFAKKSNNAEETAFSLNRMGEVQIKLNNFQQALTHFNEAQPFARESGNQSLRRTVEKNIGTSVVLLQNYLEKQKVQMEVEEVQQQVQSVRDSLNLQQDSNKILISITNFLIMERAKDSAELRAKTLESQNKDAVIATQTAKTQTLYLATAGGGIFAVLIIVFFINRSRLRKKAKEAVEREKLKSENLLFNILPTDIAKELIQHEVVQPREYEHTSILFTDFKGFTTIASQLSPEQLISELNYVFQAFDQIVEHHGLEKIKTIGDAYMAVAGVPLPHPDHALAAVAAALEMQAFMHRWKVEKEMKQEQPWELRVGINSGKVVAGVIGTKKFAYDVWGDAVNIASRMESAGEAWEVNISEDTYQLIRGRASCTARGSLPVKNRGAIAMYFVKQITQPLPPMKLVKVVQAPVWKS